MNPILKLAALAFGGALALTSSDGCAQTVIFQDTFAVNSSANWSVFSNAPDYTNQFAFAYTTNQFSRNGVTGTIPLAPSSASATETNGLKIRVNETDGAVVGVNLYPVGQSFSNDYALKFDMWLNYTGTGFGAGTGGTEDAMFGINHAGNANVYGGFGGASAVGNGVWFAVSADADATRDYQAFIGDNVGAPVELLTADGGFLDRDGDSTYEIESTLAFPASHPLKLMFPSPTYETAGMPTKQWVRVEVRQRTNDSGGHLVSWFIEGYLIAEHLKASDPLYGQTNGNIMIGMMDPFSGVGSPPADSFMIYDNVRVVDLSGVPTNEVVSVVATTPSASEPGTDGLVTISRTGSTASPLVVPFRMAGTATRGLDYVTRTNGVSFTNTAVTIPAGASSLDVTIDVLDDTLGEATERAILVLAGNPNAYDILATISAAVEILDDVDLPGVSLSAFRLSAYEGNTNRYAEFQVTMTSPYYSSPNVPGDVSVNVSIEGTAVNGTHYETIASPVFLPAGSTTGSVFVIPIQNADTVSNRTVTLKLVSGPNYVLSTVPTATNATVTIFNDDYPAGTGTLFSDDFDVDSSVSWTVSMSSPNCAADFAYDYSTELIPPAPKSAGSTTRGLRLRANSPAFTTAALSGISASPTGQSFSGDYRMRFDMWLSVPGPFPNGGAGSTQHGSAGVASGTVTTWSASTVSSNWVLFGVTGDGNNGTDYRVYCPTGGAAQVGLQVTIDTGVYAAGPTNSAAGISPQNNTHPYYALFGPQGAPTQAGTFASQSGLLQVGAMGQVWHDVVITKLGNTLIWEIDGVRMATVNALKRGTVLSTNIFVGQFDINSTRTTIALDPLLCNIVDNLVVESLPAPVQPVITSISRVSGDLQIDFTGGTGDFPELFLLRAASTVNGPYGFVGATITQLSPGVFRAVTPYTTASERFYRIIR